MGMTLGDIIKKTISNRELRFKLMRPLALVPDEPYLKLAYRVATGRRLDLENPTGYNEKLQWLKLHDRNPYYCDLVDKVKVRDIVTEFMGPGHTIPLLGTWESFDDVVFDALPNSFVLKCNHDSGSTKIIRDKSQLDVATIVELRKFYTNRLRGGKDNIGREYPYWGVKPCLLAEPFMQDETGDFPDYKFYCFDGEPKLLLVCSERGSVTHKEDYFDMDGNWLKITNGHYMSETPAELPACLEEMKRYAAQLSQGIPTVRMDFYQINNHVYFGEYTFYSAGGFQLFEPEEWEQRLGDWLKLE